jgi:histidinol-phosphatase
MSTDLTLALQAANVADRITLSYFRQATLAVETKTDQSPVTEADRATEAAIRGAIAGAHPGDAVLGEEMGSSGSGHRRWLVDPIDGTVNYVRGIPVWATLIGLEVDGSMELGVVSAPALGRRWWAQRGHGAYAGALGEPRSRLAVSAVTKLSEAGLSGASLAHFPDPQVVVELSLRVKRDRAYGDFWSHMLVAEGCCDIGLDPIVSVWDIAPLQVIVEEAGGKFTDFSGNRRVDGGNAVSTNGLLHEEVLALLSSPHPNGPRGAALSPGHRP